MERIVEPELMEDAEQVEAYAGADFAQSHQLRVTWFQERFGLDVSCPTILDLCCGAGDMTFRFARALPQSRIVAVDGSQPMLDTAARLLANEPALKQRIQFLKAFLPDDSLPDGPYALVMSHSALHHFHQPQLLWQTIRRYANPGSLVFVSDLRRPDSETEARQIVQDRAGDEHPALQHDFIASLCAAFTQAEVEAQLAAAGLSQLTVTPVGDIYLLVSGVI